MLSNKDLYNNAYRKFTPDWLQLENIGEIDAYLNENSESLINFFNKYTTQFQLLDKLQHLGGLELGCGMGSFSFFLKEKLSYLTALDCSELGVMNAKAIASLKDLNIDFKVHDACGGIELGEQFDFVLDSHLLHCLTNKQDRLNYFHFIGQHLKPGGTCLIETMVFQKNMRVPVGYFFDENMILTKTINNQNVPVRAIFKPIDIEEELKAAGFNINFLFYHNELSFNVFDEYPEHPVEYLPKTLRLSIILD